MSLVVRGSLGLCADSAQFLKHFVEPQGALIIALGDNDEASAQVLTDNGHKVLGVDLRPRTDALVPTYFRLQGDFVRLCEKGVLPKVDCVYSLSALEHFGLGTYSGCPGPPAGNNYDQWACDQVYGLLRPGGAFYLTVPYGKEFIVHGKDWRVYCTSSLRQRIVHPGLVIEEKVFFKSAGCDVPDTDGIVREEDADQYHGNPPHLTVLLRLRKEE
jgi:hypothetical protein